MIGPECRLCYTGAQKRLGITANLLYKAELSKRVWKIAPQWQDSTLSDALVNYLMYDELLRVNYTDDISYYIIDAFDSDDALKSVNKKQN